MQETYPIEIIILVICFCIILLYKMGFTGNTTPQPHLTNNEQVYEKLFKNMDQHKLRQRVNRRMTISGKRHQLSTKMPPGVLH